MAKVGDTVRFLNATGGGVITKIVDRLAYVEENGFETPVLLNELVVVLPAGHTPQGPKGAKLMFDQQAFDSGRKPEPEPAPEAAPAPPAAPLKVEETAHGDKLNLALAFEPADIKHLSETSFNAVLVNDSNYFLYFTFSTRSAEARGWTLRFDGRVAPNELIDLAVVERAKLPDYENVALQCVAYKADKEFEMKAPVAMRRRLDLKKFYKLHCFRPGLYFDTPVLEIPIVADDHPCEPVKIDPVTIASAMGGDAKGGDPRKQLSEKYRVDSGRKGKRQKAPADNPTRLLEPIEVDLHIHELTDTTAGMESADMLAMQLDTVRGVMKANSRRIGQKIIFIHGKGDGVLRNKVRDLLRRDYPKAELQDASFREYGFGATLVTIH